MYLQAAVVIVGTAHPVRLWKDPEHMNIEAFVTWEALVVSQCNEMETVPVSNQRSKHVSNNDHVRCHRAVRCDENRDLHEEFVASIP